MSESSSSSSSGSSSYPGPYSTIPSTPFTIQMPNPNAEPTDAEILAVLPNFVKNGVNDPPQVVQSNGFFWSVAGQVIDGVQLWVLKRLGWLLILDALEE